MRRLLAVVLVSCALAAPTAAAAGPSPARSAHSGREASSAAAGRVAAQRWLNAQRAAMLRLMPGPVFTGAGVGEDPPSLEHLVPAGNLVDNGKQYVLDERQNSQADGTPTVGITVRRGSTGTAVWSRRITFQPYQIVSVMTARLGAKGAPGVLVVKPGWKTDGMGQDVLLTVTALSGKTGKVIWSKTLSGYSPSDSNENGTDIPWFDGVLTGGSVRTASVLVALDTAAGDDTADAELLSGVDGSPTPFGPSENTAADGTFTSYQAIPDTNHDGRSDVLVEVPGSGGFIRALSGVGASTIWTVSGLPATSYLTPMPIGLFSGTKEPDLAFGYFDSTSDTEYLYVVSGRTGAVIWSRPATGFYVLGKAGKHLVPALGLYSGLNDNSTTSYHRTETYEAVSVANKVLYTYTVSSHVSLPTAPLTSFEYSGGVFSIGDVQPDGANEIGVDAITAAADSSTSRRDATIGIVDGKTGVFHSVAAQVGSDGSLHKGAGADLLAVALKKNKPVLTAWEGVTRRRLYRRTLAVGGWQGANVGGLRVTGHSCSDVAVTTETTTRGGYAVLSGSGHLLWSIAFSHSAVTGGKVKHDKKPKHFCD